MREIAKVTKATVNGVTYKVGDMVRIKQLTSYNVVGDLLATPDMTIYSGCVAQVERIRLKQKYTHTNEKVRCLGLKIFVDKLSDFDRHAIHKELSHVGFWSFDMVLPYEELDVSVDSAIEIISKG